MESDWQINLTNIKDRNQYLLQTEKMVDCRFLVGTSPHQRLISGHRLLLAMASPVFQCMFYGSLPESNNCIIITDVHPDAFKTMLDYIYTDEFSISSFDDACELYYVAMKYMLPHLVVYCTNFLLASLSLQNACRGYEFAKLYEEPRLMESSMELIVSTTREVIADSSFMDIEALTLMDILDQNCLNIDSELDLFKCLMKFASQSGLLNDEDKNNTTDAGNVVKKIRLEPQDPSSGTASTADEVVVLDSEDSSSGNASESAENIIYIKNVQRTTMDEAMLRQAVKKIRFLSMSPQQFTEGPAWSKLLNQNEAFAILIKISNPTINDCPMPEGFSQSSKRDRDGGEQNKLKRCCVNAYYFDNVDNSSVFDFWLTFKVNTNIYMLGVQIVMQRLSDMDNIEGFYACLQNMHGSEIARTSSIENGNDSMDFELTFDSPIFIHTNEKYKIKIIKMVLSLVFLTEIQPKQTYTNA